MHVTWVHMPGVPVEPEGNSVGSCHLLPLHGFQGLKSGFQAYRANAFTAEQSLFCLDHPVGAGERDNVHLLCRNRFRVG